jgi:carboxyl-terminal processing protease
MPRRNLLLLLIATTISYVCYVRCEHDPYGRYLSSALAAVEDNALDPAPNRELFDGAMNGMIDVLHRRGDVHSQYLGADEAGPLRNEIHQQFGGIGVRLRFEGEPAKIVIAGPISPETPAGKAKLQAGDVILKIDDRTADGLSRHDAIALLTGEPGTSLRLIIQRGHESRPRTIELTRDVIQIDSIAGNRHGADGAWLYALEADPRIAQVRIVSFGDRTAAEFAKLMPALVAQGVQAVVLDLRDNPGGSLSSAVELCEMLLPADCKIVETRGRNQKLIRRYATKSDGKYLEMPIAVIVNQYSASAAEIVAACLQDNERAVVVGERSFGKGTVQQLLPLGNGLLKLTWASFWRPSGANIQNASAQSPKSSWGVEPDAGYERKLSADEYASYRSYLNQRDDEGDQASDKQQGDTFVDEQLRLAEKYLARYLKENAENSGGL